MTFIFSHTNLFIGKFIGALKHLITGSRPKLGRWVYDRKGLIYVQFAIGTTLPILWGTGILAHWHTSTLGRWHIGALGRWGTGALGHWHTGTLGRWQIGALGH